MAKRPENRKTVLVLGAGASCPYGFPTAGDVRQLIVQRATHKIREIVTSLNTSTNLVDKVRTFVEKFHEPTDFERFRREFLLSQITSVDAFVQSRGGKFDEIARHVVAALLLHCEHAANLDGDWYQLLRNVLLETGPDFPPARCSIITFNYDRSLEHYLWRAIQYSFGLDEGVAYKRLQKLRIHHVYGSLGDLRDGSTMPVVPWGSITETQIVDAASSLHLMAPRRSGRLARVRPWLRGADVVCFLGFGFWQDNFALLLPMLNEGTQIYASSRGLPETVKDRVNGQLPRSRITWAGEWNARECLLHWNLF